MSAIFGVVNQGGRPADKRELSLMAAALAVHGPDGGGIWTQEHIGLGQCLMCFTPEDRLERQPLVSSEGYFVLVTDGRIDNRPELGSELAIPLREANEMPDSAFILESYRKWGIDCCGHLVGDFVFALSDSYRSHVLIARSPLSTRTLYYHAAPGRFVFSSAPKGLFALPWIPREIDRQRLADYLILAPRENGSSFFADIKELHSGHSLVVRRDGFRVERNWQPDPHREIRFPRDSDYVDAFNAIFDRVIADNLRSLTPVGVMMSGGLDSSSVAVTAARLLSQRGQRLNTFTEVPQAGFDGTSNARSYPDETPFVEAIARECQNLDLNYIRNDGFFLDNLDCSFNALDGPFRSTWNRMWWEAILRNASSRKTRVLLTGLPGNITVTLSGDGLFPQLILGGRWLRAFREAQAGAKREGTSALRVLARGAAPLLPTPVWLAAIRMRYRENASVRVTPPWLRYSAINPEFARIHQVEARARAKGHDFYLRKRHQTRAYRYESLGMWDTGVQVVRGYEALFRVQTRNPMADVRLVEYCLSLPEEQHRHKGVPRSLIRRAMKDRLPPEVLTNRRLGIQAADWPGSTAAGGLRMLDELPRIERCELAAQALDLAKIRNVLRQVSEGAASQGTVNARAVLGFAFMTGRFLSWFQSSSAVAKVANATSE